MVELDPLLPFWCSSLSFDLMVDWLINEQKNREREMNE